MKIRTNEKCPLCGGKFKEYDWTFLCKDCVTRPRFYYIEICWKGKPYKIYCDSYGQGLNSYDKAKAEIERIKQKIAEFVFDPKAYGKKKAILFSFDLYTKKWLKKYQKLLDLDKISQLTYILIERLCRLYYIPYFKDCDIRTIKNKDIEDFYLQLPTRLACSSHHLILKYLRSFFFFAKGREDIVRIPFFPAVETPEAKIELLDTETIDKIISLIPEYHRPLFIMLQHQGMRPNEARALWWEDINWKSETITICRGFSGDKYHKRTKNKKIRILPLHPKVLEVLYKLKEKRENPAKFIFLTSHGRHYHFSTVTLIWKNAVEAAGLPHVRLYSLRHSFSSAAMNRGIPESLVKKFLGTTVSNYTHINVNGLKSCLDTPSKEK